MSIENKIFENKIEANHTKIRDLLRNKFNIDYFQREYRWEEKHIKIFIEDLTTTFLKSYKQGHEQKEVKNYQNYYLGPMVFSINNEKTSIIDGQQRITSITLLLIYLYHLQKEYNQDSPRISELIYSEYFGEKSFNMTDDNRESCLKSLFKDGKYDVLDSDDETIINMVERYEDIKEFFPFSEELKEESLSHISEELKKESLPHFINWLIEMVVIVEIKAYSNENAYTIFETMNDRGLKLTPSEMLKGYVLTQIKDITQRKTINNLWKKQIQELHEYDKNADHSFFQAWFRGKYAENIRSSGTDKEEDFELIGSRFHDWFKDSHKKVFKIETSDEFYNFFNKEFPFFVKWFLESREAQLKKECPHLYYIKYWGIAESLQDPLLLSSINIDDDDDTIYKKLDLTARYIETYTVRRAVNYKKFGQTSIRNFMFDKIIKQIRHNDMNNLKSALKKQIDNMEINDSKVKSDWREIANFGLHGQNKKFIKHLLSRISSYTDKLTGTSANTYDSYQNPPGKPFEIEHIWSDNYSDHRNEFSQENEFQQYRNKIGALILLPNGTNQSFNSDKYKDKVVHYYKQHNSYAQTLHKDFYTKNPNFSKNPEIKNLKFKFHSDFKKKDIEERSNLVKRICEKLWSTNYFS